MAKHKTIYICNDCGAEFSKWSGQCGGCHSWNTIIESTPSSTSKMNRGFAGIELGQVKSLSEVDVTGNTTKINIGISELDRVLGGGLVAGSVVLVGGDPGIGKSTLIIQALSQITDNFNENLLYISGEESLKQIKLRANRLEIESEKIFLLAETNVERIIEVAYQHKPKVLVIDSIQTVFTEQMQSAPGSVAQIRESAAKLVHYAKENNCALFLIGHVTKEGALAGPRVLEHMVDTVLYFEGQSDNRYRILRSIKNRFGSSGEVGIFAMTEKGLKTVNNPSAIFLTRHEVEISGSIVMATQEASRTLLIEIQALVDNSNMPNPRRITVGVEQNRLSLILAVLSKHIKIPTYSYDVFINIVGGVKIVEPAIDLPIILAILSSLKDKPLPKNLVAFGEVGLSGEIRPVQNGQNRLKSAAKYGFKQAIIPHANMPRNHSEAEIKVQGVKTLEDVINFIY